MYFKKIVFIFLLGILTGCLKTGVEYIQANNNKKHFKARCYNESNYITMNFTRNYFFYIKKDTCILMKNQKFQLKFCDGELLKEDEFEEYNDFIQTFYFDKSIRNIIRRRKLIAFVNYEFDSCGILKKENYCDTLYRKRYFEFSVH